MICSPSNPPPPLCYMAPLGLSPNDHPTTAHGSPGVVGVTLNPPLFFLCLSVCASVCLSIGLVPHPKGSKTSLDPQ